MKFLLVGDGHADIHEPALARALRLHGSEVKEFFWSSYFSSMNSILHSIYRFQNKFVFGPQIYKIQKDLIKLAITFKPQVLFIYRGTHIWPETIKLIKELGAVVVCYNNDDPFSEHQKPMIWRHFIKSLRFCDLALAYRKHNIIDFINAGAPKSELFRSWYIPESNQRLKLADAEKVTWSSDILFAGHFENDGRIDLVEALAKEAWKFHLFGPEWNIPAANSSVLKNRIPIRAIRGIDYNKAIAGTKIAVAILSKLNRDTYTRRCFEIPAIGTMMLCEYSDDMANLFQADKEVVFFKNITELVQKARYYLSHDEERRKIAEAGYRRVVADGHDINSRAIQLIQLIKNNCSQLSGY